MKTKYITCLIAFFSIGMLLFSCKKTADKPPVTPFNIGNTLTISQLRALYAGSNIKFTKDISLFATVTMTDNYKTLYIKDNTGAICLKQITAHGIYAGDSIRINLNGSTLDLSSATSTSSMQLDSVDVSDSPTCKVVKLAVGRPITPITVTIAELNNSVSLVTYSSLTGHFFVPISKYDGQLVQINDVQFSFANRGPFITYGSATYVTPAPVLYDCGGITNIQMSLYSGTADFQNQSIPYNNSGSIVGAISYYSNLQITPRSFADVNFTQPRCGLQTLNQTFDTAACGSGPTNIGSVFPGWTDAKYVGYQYWAGTTSATGSTFFPSASVYYSNDTRNVTWLITPPIQNSPTKNINFEAWTNYNQGFVLLSVLVSTDYNGYNLGGTTPVSIGSQAHWTDITSSFNITTASASNTWVSQYAGGGATGLNPVYFDTTKAKTLIPSSYTGTFYVGFRYTGVKANPDSAAGYGISNVVIKN